MLDLILAADVTNYTTMRIIGIVVSLLLAGIVFAIAYASYRSALKRELAASENDETVAAEEESTPIEEQAEPVEEVIPVEAEVVEEETVEEVAPVEEAEPVEEEPVEETEVVEEEAVEEVAPVEEETIEEAEPVEEVIPVEEVAPVEEKTEAVEEETVEEVEPVEEVIPVEEAAPVEEEPVKEATPVEEAEPVEERPEEVIQETVVAKDEVLGEDYPTYYIKLTSKLTEEAKANLEAYAVENIAELKLSLKHPKEYDDEKTYLRNFFAQSAKLRGHIYLTTYETLYKRYYGYMVNDYRRSQLNTKMIGIYYYKRDEVDALKKCEKLCRQDIKLNLENRKVKNKRMPSLKRLILIKTAQKEYDEAIELCETAIKYGIIDKGVEGYEARRDKLVAKNERRKLIAKRQKERAARAAERLAKQQAKLNSEN